MICPKCRGEMTVTKEDRPYTASGLSSVVLKNAEVRRCPACSKEAVVITAMDTVHQDIARKLAAKPGRLAPEEIRFLRKHIGFSGTDFAEHMGVTLETVSRWENGAHEMNAAADKLLRLMIEAGERVPDYSLERFRVVAAGNAQPLSVEIPAQAVATLDAGPAFSLGNALVAMTWVPALGLHTLHVDLGVGVGLGHSVLVNLGSSDHQAFVMNGPLLDLNQFFSVKTTIVTATTPLAAETAANDNLALAA